jgi:hypothetical protein
MDKPVTDGCSASRYGESAKLCLRTSLARLELPK